MRFFGALRATSLLVIAAGGCWAAAGLTVPDVEVGRNLQATAAIRLPQVAPEEGVQLTVTSDDPARLLLSDGAEKRGEPAIAVKVLPRFILSADFWVHGLADHGTVTYTVSAPGLPPAKGTVTLVPAGIVILGPFNLPKFPTTPHGADSKITVVSVALDSSLKVAAEQPIAGGANSEVTLVSSNPNVGNPGVSKVVLHGGVSRVVTYFRPSQEGETTLKPVQPAGFTTPAEMATVLAAVAKPGLAIVGEVYLGKNLQLPATLCLGEAAPPGGLKVTLTSSNPSKLVLSEREDKPGSGSITITVPAGQLAASYYLQGLGDAGEVTYEAVADGFRSRTARIGLALSGVIIAYERYGPPDEATVLRGGGPVEAREFFASISSSKEHPLHLVAWMTYLDPATGRSADITVQSLRPGVEAKVLLTSSEPAVGTVESPLVIKPGANRALSRFVPLRKGKTVISVNTPMGFATPGNATTVPAVVDQ